MVVENIIPLKFERVQEQMKASVAASIAQRAMNKIVDSIIQSHALGTLDF